MCVAILKPKDKKITKRMLNDCWEGNPDGAGFAFARDGKIAIFQSLKKTEFINTLWNALKSHNENFLIHFRIKTMGSISIANSHPFVIDKDNVFAHNGHIHQMDEFGREAKGNPSDTKLFNHLILKKMGFKFNNRAHFNLIEKYVGLSNKLVFLNSSGEYKLINEEDWDEVDGVFYSNLFHCATKKTYSSYYDDSDYELFTLRDEEDGFLPITQNAWKSRDFQKEEKRRQRELKKMKEGV